MYTLLLTAMTSAALAASSSMSYATNAGTAANAHVGNLVTTSADAEQMLMQM